MHTRYIEIHIVIYIICIICVICIYVYYVGMQCISWSLLFKAANEPRSLHTRRYDRRRLRRTIMLIGHHPLLPLPRAIEQIEISQDKTTTIYCNLCLMASHIKQALKGQFRLSIGGTSRYEITFKVFFAVKYRKVWFREVISSFGKQKVTIAESYLMLVFNIEHRK